MQEAESTTNSVDSPSHPSHPLRIKLKLPQRQMNLRSSRASSALSGSEYLASEKSDENEKENAPNEKPPDEETEAKIAYGRTRAGRKVVVNTYIESSEGEGDNQGDSAANLFTVANDRRVTRTSKRLRHDSEELDGKHHSSRHSSRGKGPNPQMQDFIEAEEEEDDDGEAPYGLRPRKSKPNGATTSNGNRKQSKTRQRQVPRRSRITRRSSRSAARAASDDFQPMTSSPASADAEGSTDDVASDLDIQPEPEPEPEPEEDEPDDGRPYALRQRQPVNYRIPPPLEDLAPPPQATKRPGPHGRSGRSGHGAASKKKGPGWSATGAELGRWMGMPGNDSDSDYPTRTPRKPFGLNPFGAGAVAAGGMLPGELAAGTPSNLGKIGDAALADADPLGVNQNVTFDEVGGLDDHIHALKEMTLLPLLYPEVFQRFNVTPPRGVLFHGPPGTGKTLLARALAASCRSGGRQISFFMRKGADCLSKWVGEAERQLRLLFEEARASQPSIIFFDEIDGLAPVRSSKQDQIHASIVSTLLALMDGMDGRGQVVVIGATNRPDAVDPALRRPGRFDREFYFGLPGLEARETILKIMTKEWVGWGKSQETEEGKEGEQEKVKGEMADRIRGLAKLTKGYGGADLRALCTEAALNAIQRRYPQVYKSTDRLLLRAETIEVGLRDFMISIKKIVPSSARSSSSAASPLPPQFAPLLEQTLEEVKDVIQRVLPMEKKLTALEEAEFEDEGGEEGALEREMLSQAMQTLRVYRPRVVIHGSVGMGQGYLGAAALHFLEGFHVQSLELGTLMSDSTRTVEAAIVQLFIEAKRHQPSVIYIPSLLGWCAAISETSRSIFRAMLDTLLPTDPILLLAVIDGFFGTLPRDVKAWFGPTKDNRIILPSSTAKQREAFFKGLLEDVQRPPNRFADGTKRRKRVLEELPIAPPLEPRKPTNAELALQEENDQKVVTLLKYRLGPILTELKRKFKRFTKRATEEYNFGLQEMDVTALTIVEVPQGPNATVDVVINDQAMEVVTVVDDVQPNGVIAEQQQQQAQATIQQLPPLFDMDLERMHSDLFRGRYLTPQDFMDDVGKIVHNADVRSNEDLDRLYKAQAMFTAAQVSIQEFDPQFRLECERMAARERQRREERKKEKGKEKEQQQQATAPMPIRRSARANGLQPEHSITDPVKLERRLKRLRGELDGNGGDSLNTSEGEGLAGPSASYDGGRDPKRTRIVEERDDDRDPLDTLGQTPGSEVRSHVVRFATGPLELPFVVEPQHQVHLSPFPSQMHSNHLHPPPFPSHQKFHLHHHPQQPFPSFDTLASDLPLPLRSSGFDPALLNPIQPSEQPFLISYSPKIPEGPAPFPSHPPIPVDPSDPFISQPHPQYPYFPPSRSSELLAPRGVTPTATAMFPVQSPSLVPPHPSGRLSRQPTPMPVESNAQSPGQQTVGVPVQPQTEPTPMEVEIERTPTPLPDFHLSPTLVDELSQLLRDRTVRLTNEQLEQLRASCLGAVWRYRKEWDRDELVRELMKCVKEFVCEVEEFESDEE